MTQPGIRQLARGEQVSASQLRSPRDFRPRGRAEAPCEPRRAVKRPTVATHRRGWLACGHVSPAAGDTSRGFGMGADHAEAIPPGGCPQAVDQIEDAREDASRQGGLGELAAQ